MKDITASTVIRINEELITFIDKSPNAYFAVSNLTDMLKNNGYTCIYEGDKWELEAGKGYYVTRDGSSVIAFRIPKAGTNDTKNGEGNLSEDFDYSGFQIMASHSDSPAFKVKPNAEIVVENSYIKLNTEKYGGMIMSSWLDRPLSVAGRIVVRTEDGVETRLVNVDRDLCMIPSLAIHMDRKTNDGYVWNAQKDMLPLFARIYTSAGDCGENNLIDNIIKEKGVINDKIRESNALLSIIAKEAGVDKDGILDTDLFLYNRNKGTLYGANNEFIGSGRLDDLQCAYATMKGFVEAGIYDSQSNQSLGVEENKADITDNSKSIQVCCVFNNEEVGSSTKQGAASSFLNDVLSGINHALGKDEEQTRRMFANSFLVSADNVHALHPNHPEKADPTNRPMLNKGIVIKYNANQKYTTDAVSGGIFRRICEMADVPVQTYVNRSDIAGGSTLGNIATTRVSINAVDIGLPQLAMHSAYETAGAFDTVCLVEASKKFYSVTLRTRGDGRYNIDV